MKDKQHRSWTPVLIGTILILCLTSVACPNFEIAVYCLVVAFLLAIAFFLFA